MIYIPILGALALGIGTVLEKVILRIKKVDIKFYQTVHFLAIVLAMIPFLYFFWRVDPGAFELKNILIFVGIIISSVIANFFVFYSMKWEKITNLEPARILEPIFIVILAIIFSFFTEGLYERDVTIIVPALISGIALVFPHIKKHHLQMNKYFIAAILGSFFFALELVLSKLILDNYSAITFYFIRCLSILLISLIIFHPKNEYLNKKNLSIIFLTGVVWVLYRLAVYKGYAEYGVVFTTLITMLGPIFVYILANRFLKEKLNWKNIISSLIIMGCVVYVLLQ